MKKRMKKLFCMDGKPALNWKRVAGIIGGTGILAVLFLMAKKLRKEKKHSELILLNEDSLDKEQMMEEE